MLSTRTHAYAHSHAHIVRVEIILLTHPSPRCKTCEKWRKDAQDDLRFKALGVEEKKEYRKTLPRGTFR